MSAVVNTSASLWTIDRRDARLLSPDLCAVVNLDAPARGLTQLTVVGHPLPNGSLLGVEIESLSPDRRETLVDHYPRVGDLVATYAQTGERPFRVQIYWRAGAAQVSGADLQVSVQTSLLDSVPRLNTLTELGDEPAFRLKGSESGEFEQVSIDRGQTVEFKPDDGPGCLLFRLRQAPLSYVEMIHPADFVRDQLTRGPTGGLSLRHELFGLELEKGVILRARARGVFVPQANDESLAFEAWRRFSLSPPPLTA